MEIHSSLKCTINGDFTWKTVDHQEILISWDHFVQTFWFHENTFWFHENIAWEHFVLIRTFSKNTFISCKHLLRTSLFSWEWLFKQIGWKCLQMWEGLNAYLSLIYYCISIQTQSKYNSVSKLTWSVHRYRKRD